MGRKEILCHKENEVGLAQNEIRCRVSVYGFRGKGVGTEIQTSSLSDLMYTLRQNLQTDITNHLVAFIWGFSYCLKFTSPILNLRLSTPLFPVTTT
jgi:hypothetical protein